MEATNWFYFQSINVRIVSGKFGQSAYFNGKASIVLAIFTNNYRYGALTFVMMGVRWKSDIGISRKSAQQGEPFRESS